MTIPTPPLLGAHFSIAKGLEKAVYEAESYGCNALQMFTKNANTWKERLVTDQEIEWFRQAVLKTDITRIASHTAYLINLAAVDKEIHRKSCDALKQELIRSSRLSIPFVVLHPGAHMGVGIEKGIEKITASINRIFDRTPAATCRLLLETTAGQGTSVGHRFEQIAEMLDRIEAKRRVGVCLDTSHIFAAGYDIRDKSAYAKTIRDFDRVIGIEKLFFLHLNDSKKAFASKVDRHHHIGEGEIGLDAFSYVMNDKRFVQIPKIIETEKGKKGEDWDRINLERLRSLVRNKSVRKRN